jgi:hypothetical protein
MVFVLSFLAFAANPAMGEASANDWRYRLSAHEWEWISNAVDGVQNLRQPTKNPTDRSPWGSVFY